ncbi:MAG TPA: Ig-like domain-containing protein [Puia sp.]|nr:Ig-like domain-containing protein [Puia sp.]
MQKYIPVLLLLTLCFANFLQAQQTASFNFSSAAHAVTGWNNVAGDPSVSVRTATDASGISVSSVSTSNWNRYNSSNSAYDGGGATGGAFFPAAVMANMWFQYNSTLSGYNASVPQLQVSGLNKDSLYTLKMTTSWATTSFNLNPTRYTVTGKTVVGYLDVNGNMNTTGGAIFSNVAPDSTGKIKVYVNTVSTTNVAGISGLQIIRGTNVTPVPTVSFTSPHNGDIVPEDGNVVLNAVATEMGGTVAKVQFFQDTVKIGEVTTSPYTLTWTTPNPGTYTLMAKALDNAGAFAATSITVTVQSLNDFWSTTGNIAANADSNFLGTVDTNRLAIRTNNIERVSVLGDGTVGIGTKNTFGYKLAVNGNAIFTKVRIRAYAAWPDYVFKKEYKLPGLDSLERYIKRHQHLPGITPAATVKKEGMDIADDQAILLKKIEELTLYLIQEHKSVEKLAKEVRELKRQNQQLKAQGTQNNK